MWNKQWGTEQPEVRAAKLGHSYSKETGLYLWSPLVPTMSPVVRFPNLFSTAQGSVADDCFLAPWCEAQCETS